MTTLRRLAVTGFLVPLLLLSSCSDEEDPRPPIVAPTTGSPTPSPTESAVPADETPEQFIRRWIETDAAMQNTGDTKAYRALSSNCTECGTLADRIDAIYRKGGRVQTTPLVLKEVKREGSHSGITSYRLVVVAPESKLFETAGSEPKTLSGGRFEVLLELVRPANSWLIRSIGQVAP